MAPAQIKIWATSAAARMPRLVQPAERCSKAGRVSSVAGTAHRLHGAGCSALLSRASMYPLFGNEGAPPPKRPCRVWLQFQTMRLLADRFQLATLGDNAVVSVDRLASCLLG